MKYFLGIDGGGTKTDYLLCDEAGRGIFRCKTGPCRLFGTTSLLLDDVFAEGLRNLCKGADIRACDIASACFGMPGYGEYPEEDETAAAQVYHHLAGIPCKVVNDVEAAWAGAFALQPGINVVSGTGSISFGKDGSGRTARCGGWKLNEGSGYWMGWKALELFLKQLDRRLERTPLYAIMASEFGLREASDIYPYMTKNLSGRKEIAAVQHLLDRAAEAGDPFALKAYKEAGYELALLAKGCYNQLDFGSPAKISYTGSMFKAGKKLLDTFRSELEADGFEIGEPLLDPGQGAVLLGIEAGCPARFLENVRAGMLDTAAQA